MHGWSVAFMLLGSLFLDSSDSVWRFMLSMALMILFVCCSSVLFHCLSQRRVGGSYALRVSPAVTRLTVDRRPQVPAQGGSAPPHTLARRELRASL